MKPQVTAVLLGVIVFLMVIGAGCVESHSCGWQEISGIQDRKTHGVPSTWQLDKYPDAPTMKPYAKVVLLDQDGPGVVTLFHVSDYAFGDDSKFILRVWYDGDADPTYESLGAEDFYGHSWGFADLESDFYTAFVRYEQTPRGGTLVAMVRARDTDKITFRKSCKILLNSFCIS